jgi:hypothetical protein
VGTLELVDLDDVAFGDQRSPDRVGVDVARRPFQKDQGRLAQELDARPEHQAGHNEAGDRIEAVPAGGEDQSSGQSRGAESSDVGEHVQKRTAHVQALGGACAEQPRRQQPGADRTYFQ